MKSGKPPTRLVCMSRVLTVTFRYTIRNAMVSDIHLAAPGTRYRNHVRENLHPSDAALTQFNQTHGTL
jgi:hypothetical protein